MRPLNILVACEFSAVVRNAFLARGHDVWSCDLNPTEGRSGNHIVGDVLRVIKTGWFEGYDFRKQKQGLFFKEWDMLLAFPPCTYLCSSGLHWNKRDPIRAEKTEQALQFVKTLLDADIPKICVENPIGCISTRIRKPDQIIQPYQFGEDASKSTCLWLKNLPALEPTEFIHPRIVNGKKRWANQTDSGQNRLGPSPTRPQDRARTYHGIAEAMAQQWG